MRGAALALIGLYRRLISPLLGPRCRFYPTCSAYARESLERHGLVKGVFLAAARILRCHPWHFSADWHDPVPKAFAWRDLSGYKRLHKRKKPRLEVKGALSDDE